MDLIELAKFSNKLSDTQLKELKNTVDTINLINKTSDVKLSISMKFEL